MTSRERFLRVLNFDLSVDRLPMVEWAAWWDLTTDRWKTEGLPELEFIQSQHYFGLDPMVLLSAGANTDRLPWPDYHGGPIIRPNRTYDDLKQFLYTDALIKKAVHRAKTLKPLHDSGGIIIRCNIEGFFWFPRILLGIEPHMFSFYDQPDLMHRINTDLANFNIRIMDAVCAVLKPDFVAFTEDMSYNHGPMISKALFDEFLLPYYRKVIPEIKKHGVKVLIDSDGDITTMVPWMNQAGIEGVYPLERQAGVDLRRIRADYPQFLMLGGYDKMVMPLGEQAMRAEFERLLPVMRTGGFIPSVDHQTPPGVSLENYRIYIRLFEEYALKAVAG
jgi:hypothetical protein